MVQMMQSRAAGSCGSGDSPVHAVGVLGVKAQILATTQGKPLLLGLALSCAICLSPC